ncbi:protein TIFY 9 [Impatiens glandulifera]|uniref:protein TIFY 9 n=1 Tax=Impatiens glandulifera TaxID=253017 RepID=UPI001FB181CE|nr:protein TIFY 9 [Impatiens glandulifera]
MARTTIDFTGFGNNVSSPKKIFNRRRSFKDIQGVISKLNPEVLKTVITSGACVEQKMNFHGKSSSSEYGNLIACSGPSTPQTDDQHCTSLTLFPSLPVHSASESYNDGNNCEAISEKLPLTIFYNGSVTVFNLPKEKAENVLKFAGEEAYNCNSRYGHNNPDSSNHHHMLEEETRYDLSMARSKSLRRFLEKRKDRITPL